MKRRAMTPWSVGLGLALGLGLGPSAAVPAGGGEGSGEATVAFGEIRTAPAPGDGRGQVKEIPVTVERPGEATRRLVVRGPDELIDARATPRGEVVGDRLMVATPGLVAVLDLESGEPLLERVTGPQLAVGEDGRRVAFETLQRRFTPPEASSSVIQVIDVPALAVEPVFPERETIEPSQFGQLLAWVDDPEERHSAGPMAFSPDGGRLAFFCTHGGTRPDHPGEVYLVVVDLAGDLSRSRFVHRPFDWRRHLRPGVAAGERPFYFAVETIRWSGEETLTAEPPGYAHWLEREIAVPVPAVPQEVVPEEPAASDAAEEDR